MTICKRCMAQYDEKYGVCPRCGEPFVPQINLAQSNQAAGKKSKNLLIAIISISGIILVGVVIVLIMIFSQPNTNSELSEQISLGEKYLTEENYDEAIVAFKKAIQIDPNDPQLYIQLADAYIGKGDKDSAVETLENGYKTTGSEEIKKKLNELKNEIEYEKYISNGNNELSNKKYDKAIENFEKANKLMPTKTEAYIGAGNSYIAKDDIENAKIILNKGYEKTKDEKIKKMLDELKDDYSDLTIETGNMTDDDIKSEWKNMKNLNVEYPIFKTKNEKLGEFLDENITQKILTNINTNYITDNKIDLINIRYTYNFVADKYVSMQVNSAFHPFQSIGNHATPSSYFVDLKNCKILEINDLFAESDEDLAKELTEKINKYIDKRIIYDNKVGYDDVYKNIKNRTMLFTLNENNLTIIFKPYEIATGAAGAPEIEIPFSELNLTSTIPEIKIKKNSSNNEMAIEYGEYIPNNSVYDLKMEVESLENNQTEIIITFTNEKGTRVSENRFSGNINSNPFIFETFDSYNNKNSFTLEFRGEKIYLKEKCLQSGGFYAMPEMDGIEMKKI